MDVSPVMLSRLEAMVTAMGLTNIVYDFLRSEVEEGIEAWCADRVLAPYILRAD